MRRPARAAVGGWRCELIPKVAKGVAFLVLGLPAIWLSTTIGLSKIAPLLGISPDDPPAIDDGGANSPPQVEPPRSNGPVAASRGNGHALQIHGDHWGQFYTRCVASGVAIHCLVDTGASGPGVMMTDREGARHLGIDLSRLSFDGTSHTANGTIRIARTNIARLEVGPFVLSNVPILVGTGSMEGEALLGMEFLRRFKLSISADTLIISE